jgi:sulfite reductase alpha subunit-like flavoprotein
MSIPRRSFFASLLHFAGSSTEDEIYQKDRLLELANPELIDELWDYTTRPKRTIIEVLMDFTTLKIPFQYLLEVVPVMRGRQFSIASGGALTKNSDGTTRVQLLIAIADPPSPIIKWRRRYGVCTRYIATLREQQQICVNIEPGYLDVRREESVAPVVLVGPGTGVAPLRALVHQRVEWAKEGTSHGDVLLFFGCRSAETDFFFKEEWAQIAVADERLQVLPAFSRPKRGESRQYVQDLMRAEGGKIADALVRKNGKVYVCGSSGAMPKGVREALVDVMVKEEGMKREAAEVYLEGMEKSGRYLQETW